MTEPASNAPALALNANQALNALAALRDFSYRERLAKRVAKTDSTTTVELATLAPKDALPALLPTNALVVPMPTF